MFCDSLLKRYDSWKIKTPKGTKIIFDNCKQIICIIFNNLIIILYLLYNIFSSLFK